MEATELQAKTFMIEQPNGEKLQLELNVSQFPSDTTAIWSFAIAMGVAMIFGIASTIIAIWYGRKSFVLTKYSFECVIEQIKSSAQVAQEASEKSFNQQKEIQERDLIFRKEMVCNAQVRKLSASYMRSITNLIYETAFLRENSNGTNQAHDSDTTFKQRAHKITMIHQECILLLAELDQYFRVDQKQAERVIKLADIFNELFFIQIVQINCSDESVTSDRDKE